MLRIHTEEELNQLSQQIPSEIEWDIRDSVKEIARFPMVNDSQYRHCGPAVVIYDANEEGELKAAMPITSNVEPESEEYFVNRQHVITKKLFIVPKMNSEVITYMVEGFEEHYARIS